MAFWEKPRGGPDLRSGPEKGLAKQHKKWQKKEMAKRKEKYLGWLTGKKTGALSGVDGDIESITDGAPSKRTEAVVVAVVMFLILCVTAAVAVVLFVVAAYMWATTPAPAVVLIVLGIVAIAAMLYISAASAYEAYKKS